VAAVEARVEGQRSGVITAAAQPRRSGACVEDLRATEKVSGPETCRVVSLMGRDERGRDHRYRAWVCEPQDVEVDLY
jgi:hypothetical protein